ncbi:MAG: hypothetical protein IJK27_00600 [Bacilli bacterium]|nr:hypothetical protein [Prevotella sp.]MBR0439248.1 hypothetical protein [Bacilli bacterium]
MNKTTKNILLILPFIVLIYGVIDFTKNASEELYGPKKVNPLYGTWYTIIYSLGKDVYVEIIYNDDNTCIYREYDDKHVNHRDIDKGRFELEKGKIYIWWESMRDSWDKDGPVVSTYEIKDDKLITDDDESFIWKRLKKEKQ